jgi:hypothetical protein
LPLLALFLTILFVVKGSVMFRGGRARLGGAGLYRHRFRLLGQGLRDFGGRRARRRATGEGHSGATLLVFLFAYLNLNRWHVRYSHITLGWSAFWAR